MAIIYARTSLQITGIYTAHQLIKYKEIMTSTGRKRQTERVINVLRVDSEVKISSPKLTRRDLFTCDTITREAKHLPQMSRRFVEGVFRIRFVFEQSVTDSDFEYLKIRVSPQSVVTMEKKKSMCILRNGKCTRHPNAHMSTISSHGP
jgi:hypothetical protein